MKFTIKKILLTLCIASLSQILYAKSANSTLPIVTAGYAGDGAISLDNGATWKTVTLDPQHGQQFNDITWAKNQFVGVGYGYETTQSAAEIFTSPDGLNWTSRVTQPMNMFSKIVYVNNLFFTIGSDIFYISSDGINWQAIMLPPPLTDNVETDSVAWGDNRYVMVGTSYSSTKNSKDLHHTVSNKPVKNPKDSSFYFTALSLDGINWTVVQQSIWLSNVIWLNNQFVAEELYSPTPTVFTSPDGQTWTPTNQYTTWTWYVNNTFFNVTQNALMRSQDGKTWTIASLPVSSTFQTKKIIYKNNEFLLCGNDPTLGGEVLSSSDGITWSVMMTNMQNSVDAMG